MIAYPRAQFSGEAAEIPGMRVIGLGNAGVHLADRLVMAGVSEVAAMNTDVQSLTSSIVPMKITLGQKATRGLGAGGDPEVGCAAAHESREEIRSAVEGVSILFLCAGLGGGTSCGVAPLLAAAARETGATVFAVVTSPFSFEGRRRGGQAAETLALLARHCSALIHFENDRMAEMAAPRSGIEETFAASDEILASCVASLIEILKGGSPMPVGLADVLSAVGGGSPAGLFGRGESSGENRAHEALERALKCPLLDRGRLLGECHAVIAHLAGPPSLSFSEVAAVMREIARHTADSARLFLGVTTVRDSSAPLSVTLFGNYQGTAGAAAPADAEPDGEHIAAAATEGSAEKSDGSDATSKPKPRGHRPAEAPPVRTPSTPAAASPAAVPEPDKSSPRHGLPPRDLPSRPAPQPAAQQAKAKQETLQFEAATRGRFEKSEPTIVEGEDLDVPTFLRLRGKTK